MIYLTTGLFLLALLIILVYWMGKLPLHNVVLALYINAVVTGVLGLLVVDVNTYPREHSILWTAFTISWWYALGASDGFKEGKKPPEKPKTFGFGP